MKVYVLAFGLLFGTLGSSTWGQQEHEPREPVRGDQPGVLFLGRSAGWTLEFGGKPHRGLLTRELARQAVLIAARDGLGLNTRDAWLGEQLPAAAVSRTLDLVVSPGDPCWLQLLDGVPPTQSAIWDHDLHLPVQQLDYRELVVQMELLSRTQFVEALRPLVGQGLFGARPDKWPLAPPSDAALPDRIERLLGELTFTSQFLAAREIHALLRREGESPELLGGLVRSYANLGSLSELYWHPMHEVFKARALLYAQRMVAQTAPAPQPLWHRGYAFALVGLHRLALDDFQQAEIVRAEGDQPLPRPMWVGMVADYCRYDLTTLQAASEEETLFELAHLLRSIAAAQSGDLETARQVAAETRQAVPQCYRVHAGLWEADLKGTYRHQHTTGADVLAENLYARLDAMPGLPGPARTILKQYLAGGSLPGSAEATARDGLIRALLESNEADSADDVRELSWAVLGKLIQELTFLQVWLGSRQGGWDEHDHRRISSHPYRHVFPTRGRAELQKLLDEWDYDALEWKQQDLFHAVARVSQATALASFDVAERHRDLVPRELLDRLPFISGKQLIERCRRILDISPYSPAARTLVLKHDWQNASRVAPQWEKRGWDFPLLLAALGNGYLADGKLDDAQRVLQRAVELAPTLEATQALGRIYWQRGDFDRWQAAYDRFLKATEDEPLAARVRVSLANEFMRQRQWHLAKDYAEAAAESRRADGLLAAAKVAEALQDWRRAEDAYRELSAADPWFTCEWFFWCRRTGQGDRQSALAVAEQTIAEYTKPRTQFRADLLDFVRPAVFHLLFNDHTKALHYFKDSFMRNGDPFLGLHAALISDELKQPTERDLLLDLVRTKGPKYRHRDRPREELLALAKLLVADLAREGKPDFDAVELDKLSANASPEEQAHLHYFLGKYFDLRGQPDMAIQYWTKCMTSSDINSSSRTLAGDALIARGHTPAEYRDQLLRAQPK